MIRLETTRLLIRPFIAGDLPSVYEYLSNPAVMKFIPEGVFTEEQTKEFIEANMGETAEKFAVILKEDNCLIGHIAYHPWFMTQTYELGWVFNPRYHNKGYASEAAAAFIKYGFDTQNLHRIIATCQPQNPPSYRVMEKIGMRREGEFRQCIYRENGEWWDELFYAVLKEDWLQGKEVTL